MAHEGSLPPRLKRRYLINTRFQLKYTFLAVGLSTVLFFLFGYKIYQQELEKTRILQIQQLDLQGLVETQDFTLLYYLLALFLVQVFSLVILGIFLTHRIAGPVHRVHKYLEEIAQSGKMKPLARVRSHDEFSEFFDSLGSVVAEIGAKEQRLKHRIGEIRDQLQSSSDDATKIGESIHLCDEILSKEDTEF